VNDHFGCTTVQPSDGLSVPTNQLRQNPTNHPSNAAIAIATRASATMPAAPQSFEPAGSGPNTNQPRGVMNFQSTINPLASSDMGGTAGHVAAACVSARGECDCECVRDARDANCILLPTTLSPRARQVVVPQAQNLGTSAAALALVPQPSTFENAGAAAPEVSTPNRAVHFMTDPPVADDEGWTKVKGKTARGRAKWSAKCGTSVPSAAVPAVPAVLRPLPAARRPTRSSVHPATGVTSLDAVAPPVTPPVPFAAVRLPPWEGASYNKGTLIPPSVRAVPSAGAPSVALPAPPGGVTPGNAASPVVDSASPTTISQAASTNDSPIPVGASAASTNDPKSNSKSISSIDRTPLSGSYPCECGTSPSPPPVDLPLKSGIKPNAAAETKAQPANNTIFTGDTSSNPDLSTTKGKRSKKRLRQKKKKNLTTDVGITALPVLAPGTNHKPLTAEEELDYVASRLAPPSPTQGTDTTPPSYLPTKRIVLTSAPKSLRHPGILTTSTP